MATSTSCPPGGSEPTATSSSIYLDNEEKGGSKKMAVKAPPSKRLTMAQRATLEAMASFGGTGLSSMAVRKVDLKSQLKEEERNWRKREGEEVDGGSPPAKKTRLQASKKEVMNDIKLGSSLTAATSQPTAADTAAPNNSKNEEAPVNQPSPHPPPPPRRRLTRVEKARLEALKSFGGEGLGVVLSGAKRKVAKTLEKAVPSKNEKEQNTSDEVEGREEEGNGQMDDSEREVDQHESIGDGHRWQDSSDSGCHGNAVEESSDACAGQENQSNVPDISVKDPPSDNVCLTITSAREATPTQDFTSLASTMESQTMPSDVTDSICEADSTSQCTADSFTASDLPPPSLSPAE